MMRIGRIYVGGLGGVATTCDTRSGGPHQSAAPAIPVGARGGAVGRRHSPGFAHPPATTIGLPPIRPGAVTTSLSR